jgi:hypothetical protein
VTNICSASCTEIQSGNTVIIQGTVIGGSIVFNQSCTVSMECEINNNLSTDVSNILASANKQTSITANGFPDFNFNGVESSITASQIITNTLTNLIDNTCSNSSNQIQSNNYTYVSDSNIAGSLQFDQTANVTNSCNLTNRSSIQLSNQASIQNSQSATILDTTALIVALIIVVIIVVIIIFVIGRFKKGGGGTTTIQTAPLTPATTSLATMAPEVAAVA